MTTQPLADSRVKGAVIAVAATAGILVLTQLVFPGRTARGTPMAFLFTGFVAGMLNALIAAGLVLVYRSHRIINFAQLALGTFGGVFAFNLYAVNEWPFALAVAAGLAVSAVTGLAMDLGIVRRFFKAPRLVLTVFTIALIPLVQQTGPQLSGMALFRPVQDRTIEQVGGQVTQLPFDGFEFQIGGFPQPFGFRHLFALGAATLSLLLLGAFLRFTRLGTAVRAAAENSERAQLLGISVGSLSTVVWTIAGLLAGVTVISQGLVARQFSFAGAPPDFLFVGLAGAVLARMRSLPVAIGSAIGLSVLFAAFGFSYEEHATPLVPAFVLIVIVGAMLFQRERKGRSEEAEASSWRANDEPRPMPKEMVDIPGIKLWRRAGAVVGLGALLLWPWVATSGQTNLGGYYLIIGIVMISLAVLTGWAGQISLGQLAFVAFGAIIAGSLTARVGMSFWLAILITPVLTAVITGLVGFPALRIRGLMLAVATLAFAFAAESVLFQERYFGWLLPEGIDRPSLFLFDFEDERSMYYLCLAGLVVAVILVSALRRSRPGRILIGMRENENNLRSFGIDPVRMRLTAFVISGFLCGFAGVLLAHHQRAITDADFQAVASLQIFLFAVVGGVGSVFGVLLGTGYFAFVDLLTDENWILLFGSVGLLIILYIAPGGLSQLWIGLRDNVLRIVAQRRQMIVPSLFADYDPETFERQLIPLASPIPGAGAAALPASRRYRRDSELYGARGRVAVAQKRRATEDAQALGAAAKAAEDDGVEERPATEERTTT